MIRMLRALTDKVDSMQEQKGSISREIEILGKNQKEMLKVKTTLTEMENAFDGLFSRLDMAEKRISEFEISTQTAKTEKQ